jgi:hypothetical protein
LAKAAKILRREIDAGKVLALEVSEKKGVFLLLYDEFALSHE